MKSFRTERFRRLFTRLPQHVQRDARDAYRLFLQDPQHPSLHFKRVHPVEPMYSVRINREYRAVGFIDRERIVWDFIGAHSDYEHYISQYK